MTGSSPHPIGIGLVGVTPGADFRKAGWAYVAHLPAIQALDEYRLSAVSSRSTASAQAARIEFGIDAAHETTASLVADPMVDLVAVTVRVPAHFEVIETALRGGKAVFSEWPLALDHAQASALAELARTRGLRCGVSLQARGSPVVRYVRDLVRDGWLGEILATSMVGSGMNWGPGMTARNDYTLDKRNGASLLAIVVGHALDALQYCLGEIHEVSAMSALRRPLMPLDDGRVLPVTAEDQWVIAARLADDAIASVHFRGGSVGGDNFRWEINGTEGDLVVTCPFGNIQPFTLELAGARQGAPLARMPVPRCYQLVDGLEDPAFNVAQTYRLFAQDLRGDTRECADFEDARALHALLDAVDNSARTGRRIRRDAAGNFN